MVNEDEKFSLIHGCQYDLVKFRKWFAFLAPCRGHVTYDVAQK